MTQEIERKFLINLQSNKDSEIITEVGKHNVRDVLITRQGYLSTDPNKTIRIRIQNTIGFITIKGKSNDSGLSRYEWEKKLEYSEAIELFNLCDSHIKKVRLLINYNEHLFELDIFKDDNEGLIVAEIELKSEDEEFDKPYWLGKEVTGDPKYYNSNLLTNPYKNWKDE